MNVLCDLLFVCMIYLNFQAIFGSVFSAFENKRNTRINLIVVHKRNINAFETPNRLLSIELEVSRFFFIALNVELMIF
jgi:hypothetical protein